jgi:cytochrome P450
MSMSEQSPAQVKYDILSPAFFADPYPTLDRMRTEDPIYWHPQLMSWVLTRYDDIQKVLRDAGSKFSAKRVEQYSVGAPEGVQDKLRVCNQFFAICVAFVDPPQHARLRALVSRALTVQAVERMRPLIQGMVDSLLAQARPRGRMDIIADFAGPLPLRVFAALMGVPEADLPRLKGYVAQINRLFGAGLVAAEDVEACHAGIVSFSEYFEAYIAQRRTSPTDDLLSSLIAARVDGTLLNDDELVAMAVTLMIGGHETTTNMITNGMLALLRHPDQLRKLRDDPQLLDSAIEEMMRYDGPTLSTFRRAVVDNEEFDGVKIAAGDFVLSMIYGANRDPRRFPEPDRFDIERPDNRHMSFSGGIHTCPGAALSRLQARIAISSLLAAAPELRLDIDTLEYVPHMMIRGVHRLPVVLG